MSKVKPSTKEQLVYFFITNVSLGTYDKRFLTNLESMNLTPQKPLTTNQADLFSKIIVRYTRQLHKMELNVDEMLNLPWSVQPIQSLPQFTEAHLSLLEDEFILHSPFKKDFVDEFKSADINGKWNRDDRYWSVPASTYTLSIATRIIEKHYTKVNYCDSIQDFIQEALKYEDCKYWNPTLVYLNDKLYIVAANEKLMNAISNIPFEIELYVLSKLISYGVTISDSALSKFVEKFSDDEILFALDPDVHIEVDDPDAINKLLSIKTDCVVLLELTGSYKNYFKTLKAELSAHNIKYYSITVKDQHDFVEVREYDYPVLIVSGLFSRLSQYSPVIRKVVHIVNSQPVKIK